MQNRATQPGNQGNNKEQKEVRVAKEKLLKDLDEKIERIKDYHSSLEDDYASSAMKNLSKEFENLSKDFIRYKRSRRHKFHKAIRSELCLQATDQIINSAAETARWFEACSKGQLVYNGVDGRLMIYVVLIELENLRDLLVASV